MTELREDGFLGGRLRILQPARGYRAGADAVMLAAACPARAGDSVLELGCGAGVALLCLGARVPGLHLAGLELQPAYAELARRNAAANAIPAELHQGDLARMPAELRGRSFDHVIANPPYFTGGPPAPDAGRGRARHEATPLPQWVEAALSGPAGAIAILPVAARAGREAGRIIVSARKGARAPLRLLTPFVMHAKPSHAGDQEDLTEAAQAVLRGGAALSLEGPNFR